jgi:hypothetical protein
MLKHQAAKVRDPKCPCCRPGTRKQAKTIISRSSRRAAKLSLKVSQ